MAVIELSTLIRAPRERVFDLARSIDAHQDSTGGTEERAVAGVTKGLIGMNGELSTVALPLKPGRTTTVYVAGEGIDEIAAGRISSTSPFLVINRETVKEEFDIDFPAIGFEITVAPNIPPGDYSLVLESTDGEVVYLAGVVTIEPGL